MKVSKVLRKTPFGYIFWCPGCDKPHQVQTSHPGGYNWTFNSDVHQPTFGPSLLVRGRDWDDTFKMYRESVCHSFVEQGQIRFLGDCTHQLANQTVPVPDWPRPDWGGVTDAEEIKP